MLCVTGCGGESTNTVTTPAVAKGNRKKLDELTEKEAESAAKKKKKR